ncbi:hypothetical protein D3C81_2318990 [compost metagenome]
MLQSEKRFGAITHGRAGVQSQRLSVPSLFRACANEMGHPRLQRRGRPFLRAKRIPFGAVHVLPEVLYLA